MNPVKMSPSLMNEYGSDQNSVVAIEVKGLEALQKFKQYQANGLECNITKVRPIPVTNFGPLLDTMSPRGFDLSPNR